MSEQIKKSDLISDIDLKEEIQSVTAFLEVISKLKVEIELLAKSGLKEVMAIDPKTIEGLKKVADAKEKVNKITTEAEKLAEEESKLKKQLIDASDKEVKGRLALQKANADQRKSLKNLLDLEKTEEGSRAKAIAQNKVLKAERDNLNLSTIEGKKRLEELNSTINQNNDFLTENADKLQKQRDNVGNYANDILAASSSLGIFSKEIQIVKNVQGKVVAGFKLQKQAILDANGAVKILGLSFKALGLGLVIAALAGLASFLTKTQRGIELVELATTGLQAVMAKLIDFVIPLGEAIVNAFINPKEAIKDFGKLLKEFVLDRFENLVKSVGLIGKAFKQLFAGDFNDALETAKEGLVELSKAAVVGLLPELIENIKEGIGEMADEISRSAKAAIDLKKQLQILDKAQAEYTLTIAKNNEQLKETLLLAKDEEASVNDRLEAINKIKKALIEQTEQEEKFAAERLRIIKAQNALSESTQEDRQREIDAEIALIEVRTRGFEQLRTLQRDEKRLRNEAEKELQEIREREKQGAIDEINTRIKLEETLLQNKILALGETEKELREKLEAELIEIKVKNLIELRDLELENADLTANQRLLIEAETESKILALRKKTVKEEAKIAKEGSKQIFTETEKLANDLLRQRANERKRILDNEFNQSQQHEDRLRGLAEQRVLFANESLAAEKAAQKDIENERLKQARKEQRQAAISAAFKLLGNYAQGGSQQPFADAFKDVTAMLAAIGGMQFFADGTESVKGGIKGKDSVLSMVMPDERIMTVAQNKKVGDISNEELANVGWLYRNGAFDHVQKVQPISSMKYETNNELIERLNAVEKAIKEKPVPNIDPHALAGFITERITTHNKTERKHFKNSSIF